MRPKNLAVFISGFGSNLNVILENKNLLNHLLVVSSKSEAFGVQRAKEHQVPTLILDKPIDWQALQERLVAENIQGIFLAGFMRIVPESFINQWAPGAIINLHPSLLPDYKGLKAIERAYEDQADIGVSIHQVIPEVDGGSILLQEVAVTGGAAKNLSLDEVKKQVHQKEHELVLRWLQQWVETTGKD